jgi:hypothetical protein
MKFAYIDKYETRCMSQHYTTCQQQWKAPSEFQFSHVCLLKLLEELSLTRKVSALLCLFNFSFLLLLNVCLDRLIKCMKNAFLNTCMPYSIKCQIRFKMHQLDACSCHFWWVLRWERYAELAVSHKRSILMLGGRSREEFLLWRIIRTWLKDKHGRKKGSH